MFRRLTLPITAVLAVGLGACSGHPASSKSAAGIPTAGVSVPAGVTLTEPGSNLPFGTSAQVAYAPNPKRGTVLRLSVVKAEQGKIADLAAYSLDAAAAASTPYYVTVRVTNVGPGDLGGGDVPVWAVDSTNALVHASRFSNSFARCQSTGLPASFGPSATAELCQLYLIPNHGALESLSYRPVQQAAPILWTGTVGATTPPRQPPAKGKKKPGKKQS